MLRWVDDDLSVREEFTGLYVVPSIEASTLVFVVDTLLRMNLTLAKARRQCYDEASNMSGIRKGVAKLIKNEELMIFTHCYSHSLNLAAGDTIKKCKTVKKVLETTHEITKLVKYSPRRENLFHTIKVEMAPVHLVFVPFVQPDGQSVQIQCRVSCCPSRPLGAGSRHCT